MLYYGKAEAKVDPFQAAAEFRAVLDRNFTPVDRPVYVSIVQYESRRAYESAQIALSREHRELEEATLVREEPYECMELVEGFAGIPLSVEESFPVGRNPLQDGNGKAKGKKQACQVWEG